MSSHRKQTLPDLMIITGAMLAISAIPIGFVCALECRFLFHFDWHWTGIGALAMMISSGLIGVILLYLGEHIVKKRWKSEKTTNCSDEK